jgi:anthranilate phosphoribosyltransferase
MKDYLKKLIKRENLKPSEIRETMELILDGQVPASQIGAFLALLSLKGETAEEVTEIVKVLRAEMIQVDGLENALDIVGTGGDGYDTINVSTLACFVCAYLGVPVAKHGARALSSKCGSFDLLDALGVPIPQTSREAESYFRKYNIVFLFAPYFHPALKKLHPIRTELGIRTIFNFVGPLLNPGNPSYQVIGVSSPRVATKIGETLMNLGRKRALVIHSQDGLDEASISAPTDVYDYAPDRPVRHYILKPETYYPMETIRGGLAEENAKRFKVILSGKGTEAENEFVALNAALGLYAAGKVKDVETGRVKALNALKSGNIINILEKILPNKLDAILSDKKQELELLKKFTPLHELEEKVKISKRKIRDFKSALENNSQVSLIAEIKKASPSVGDININVDIKEQAKIYEANGVSAISVLTNINFKGEVGFLEEIRQVTTIPIIRKDFIFDPYQIYESYLAGADALLLIAAVLDEKTLCELVDLTHKLGMECLVETHTKEDIVKALKTKAKIIGINARDLKTFKVDLNTIINLTEEIPSDRIVIAESGIETSGDVKRLTEAGVRVILAGTALMKARDVGAKINELRINI